MTLQLDRSTATARRRHQLTSGGTPCTALAGRRLIRLLIVILLVSLLTMILLRLLPGGPGLAIVGENATPEQVHMVEKQLGVHDPFIQQYGRWLGGIFTGDLGRSYLTKQPVMEALRQRLPTTLELASMAFVLALLVSIPVGVYSAYKQGGRFDRTATVIVSGILGVPPFLLAVVLLLVFAVSHQIFPATGWVPLSDNLGNNLWHAILPTIALSIPPTAQFTRLLRNDMAITLQEDYILAARARGLSTRRILFRHALRPSSFSLVTVAGVVLGGLLGGTVVIEGIFALPGLGGLVIFAINSRDYIMLRGAIVGVAIAYVVLNALVDLSYPLLDPRVRSSTGKET
jgi:peptide/nickel transport system permease protein